MTEKERRELEEWEAEDARQKELEKRGGFIFTIPEIVVFLSAYTVVLLKILGELGELGDYNAGKSGIIWEAFPKAISGTLAMVGGCGLAGAVGFVCFKYLAGRTIYKIQNGPVRFFVEVALVIAAVGVFLWLITLWH